MVDTPLSSLFCIGFGLVWAGFNHLSPGDLSHIFATPPPPPSSSPHTQDYQVLLQLDQAQRRGQAMQVGGRPCAAPHVSIPCACHPSPCQPCHPAPAPVCALGVSASAARHLTWHQLKSAMAIPHPHAPAQAMRAFFERQMKLRELQRLRSRLPPGRRHHPVIRVARAVRRWRPAQPLGRKGAAAAAAEAEAAGGAGGAGGGGAQAAVGAQHKGKNAGAAGGVRVAGGVRKVGRR